MDDHTVGRTVDELARDAGLPVSTIRLYRQRGLLPPPSMRGRVGYYDEAHVQRLRVIAELQRRGFSLAAIKELLDATDRGDSLRTLLGLDGTRSTWAGDPAVAMSYAELAATLPHADLSPATLARVVELGLVELIDGETASVADPTFLRVGGALTEMGVPTDVVLDQYATLQEEMAAIADRFTEVFRAHVWPSTDQATPAEIVARLEELGTLAEGVVIASLRQALVNAAEAFVEAEARRLGSA